MTSLFDSVPSINGFAVGEALADEALQRLRVHRAALIRALTVAALRVVLQRGQVCADDVRMMVPIPAGISPKCVGCVFRDLATMGILRRAGFRKSCRPTAHARPLTIWHLADADAATSELAALTNH